jgi:hypothetical protein
LDQSLFHWSPVLSLLRSIPIFFFPDHGRRGVDQNGPKHGENVVGGVKNRPILFVGVVRRVDLFVVRVVHLTVFVAGVVRRVGLTMFVD